jgi:hypothetical protein
MDPSRFWPKPDQLLLLQLCLQKEGERAVVAWECWKKKVNLDDLDHASFRIMSLAYTRLVELQIPDPDLGRIKGIYRYQWTKNKLAFRGKAELLHAFAAAAIPTLLLKGAALCQTVYRDPTARPMHDLDLLVPVNDAARVVRLLQERGWLAQHFAPEVIIQHLHACSFLHPQYGELDLHWHVLRSYCHAGKDAELWAAAVEHLFEGAPTKILCPADQFLHACEHGMHHSPSSSLQWLVDACLILRHSRSPMDWERLLDQARQFELVLPVYQTLCYLKEQFQESVPDKVLQDLSHSPVALTARVEYFLAGRSEEKQQDYLHRTGLLLCHYLRNKRGRSTMEAIRSFPLYLRLSYHYERGLIQGLWDLSLTILIHIKMKLQDVGRYLGAYFSDHPAMRQKRALAFSSHEISGFYRAETILGQTFRWSEPEASLQLELVPGEDRLIWEFPEFCHVENCRLRNPVFRINNQILSPERMIWKRRHVILQIPRHLPGKNSEPTFRHLAWSVTAFQPSGKDKRLLGLPLFRIWIHRNIIKDPLDNRP